MVLVKCLPSSAYTRNEFLTFLETKIRSVTTVDSFSEDSKSHYVYAFHQNVSIKYNYELTVSQDQLKQTKHPNCIRCPHIFSELHDLEETKYKLCSIR